MHTDANRSRLRAEDFEKISHLIESKTGIQLPKSKQLMVESRLVKRLRAMNIESLDNYCDLVFQSSKGEAEISHLIDVLTTNKTDFFREAPSFDFIRDVVLPQLLKQRRDPQAPLLFWSAACSTGEEPYTLAFVLEDYRRQQKTGFDYKVLGSDISTQALDTAKTAIYDEFRIQPIPQPTRKAYLLRSRQRGRMVFRIAPEIRRKVIFRRINLMEPISIRPRVDLVLVRNVLIYFQRGIQQAVLRRICNQIATGGYLITGHSETLNGMDLPVRYVGPMLYRITR